MSEQRVPAGKPCPSRSPESGAACVLPDVAEVHDAGHESERVGITRVCWATTPEERARWVALHEHAWVTTGPRTSAGSLLVECVVCGDVGFHLEETTAQR